MTDVVVTIPQSFGLDAWIAEGPDLPGHPWSGEEWHFYLGGPVPCIQPGERVYCVYRGHLIGYAPLVRIEAAALTSPGQRGYALVRHGGAVAVTIPDHVRGFRGYRYRWWDREHEFPFPTWQQLAR